MITIYSKHDCPNCTKLKAILQTKNITYNELILDTDFTREDLIKLNPLARSFPQMLHEGDWLTLNELLKSDLL